VSGTFFSIQLFVIHYSLITTQPKIFSLTCSILLLSPALLFYCSPALTRLSLHSLGEGGRRTPQFNIQSRQIGTKLIIFFRFFSLFHFFSPLFIKTHQKSHHFLTLFNTISLFLTTFCRFSSLFHFRFRADSAHLRHTSSRRLRPQISALTQHIFAPNQRTLRELPPLFTCSTVLLFNCSIPPSPPLTCSPAHLSPVLTRLFTCSTAQLFSDDSLLADYFIDTDEEMA
jgi:hypothetical protein